MCLDKITTPKKLKSDGTGYKIFTKTRSGHLYFHLFQLTIGKKVRLPMGVWMKEGDFRHSRDKHAEKLGVPGHRYPMGFHVYLNKKEAKERACVPDVLIPVKFRKAHTKGKQSGLNVIVAKEIFIQKEV